jgi:glycosyltransferase involved in cell wall biosynthesis
MAKQKPDTAPEVSVIVPSVNSYDDLDGCLKALEADQGARIEIIVIDRLGEHVRHFVRLDHLGVRVIAMPPDATIPDMRAKAIRAATAPAVAVIEDHVIVPPRWARAMLDALGDGSRVVGGPVDNAATDTLVDWAAFLCEYSSTLPPLPEGRADWLPGNNVIYPTPLLRRHDAVLDEGEWESRLHDAIRADGTPLMMHNANVAGHKMHYTFGLYMSQRYLYSRSYAGAKSVGMGTGKRIIMGLASLVALPPLMLMRTVRRITTKGRYKRELRRSLPLLLPFCLSWGAGEAMGYWFGPGRSLSRVR